MTTSPWPIPPQLLSVERTPMRLTSLSRHAQSRPGGEILGFHLPPFQRPPVWNQAQQIRFLESAWLGFNLGELVITETGDPDRDGLIIDGQQRLTALQAYLRGDFAVFGARWPDLDPPAQREFKGRALITVAWLRGRPTQDELFELYTRMNYGGTPHLQEQP